MNYRSVADMHDALIRNLHRFPRDIDLVVGIPRSGILAANLLSLITNIRLTDLDSFLEKRVYSSGISTKRTAGLDAGFDDIKHVLVIDDSIKSGAAMRRAREQISAVGVHAHITFATVYGLEPKHPEVDIVMEQVTNPRIFQWNFAHHIVLEKSCVDIDGVLCLDPTEQENDDGEAYRRFLRDAVPLYTTSRRIGWLVTSRLEKYRDLTETWLKQQGIAYGELIMLDLPSKAERQRQGVHGTFKAEFYKKTNSKLFIESEHRQADVIAYTSGKPVLCIETQQMHMPDPLSAGAVRQQFQNLPTRLKQGRQTTGAQWKRRARNLLGDSRYQALKKIVRPQPRD